MPAPKTKKRPEAKARERVSITVVLPIEMDTLLGVVAAKHRTNKSALIAESLKPTLKGWSCSQRGNGPGMDGIEDPPPAALQSA